jgi:hypothetical protein
MSVIKNARTTAVIAAVLAVVALGGGGLWYWQTTEDDNPYPMKDDSPARQEKAATAIVAGLNSRDPDNVDVIRNHSGNPDRAADNALIAENITAVLPLPGCQYTLVGVEDRGEQDVSAVPWFAPSQARGFDMNLQQLCPGRPPTSRIIRVVAIPSGMGGYWAEAALFNQK